MDYRQLECFLAVIDEGSFVKAAATLFISQPALSQHIQKFEKQVGAPVFDRSTRPVSLTPIGGRVESHVRRLISGYDELRNMAADIRGGATGTVRVGISQSLMLGVIPALLGHYSRQNPDVALELEAMPTKVLIERLQKETFDAIFIYDWPGTQLDLPRVPLFRDPYSLALPTAHGHSGRVTVRPDELKNEKWLLLEREALPGYYDSVVAMCHAAGFTPNITTTRGAIYDRLGMVAANLGVSPVPRSLMAVQVRGVSYVPVAGDVPSITVSMYRRTSVASYATTFVEYVEDSMPELSTDREY